MGGSRNDLAFRAMSPTTLAMYGTARRLDKTYYDSNHIIITLDELHDATIPGTMSLTDFDDIRSLKLPR